MRCRLSTLGNHKDLKYRRVAAGDEADERGETDRMPGGPTPPTMGTSNVASQVLVWIYGSTVFHHQI